MIRVRRSSIRSLGTSAPALVCFLSITRGDASKVTRGCAVIRPPEDLPVYFQAAEQAAHYATEIRASSVFDFWVKLRDALTAWHEANDKPAAAASFALALIERALVDAYCRSANRSFATALRENTLQIDLGKLCKPLAGRQPAAFLPIVPLKLDLQYAICANAPLATLTDAIARGFSQFQIGLGGDPGSDLARLSSLAEQLDQLPGDYAVSLEGNAAFVQTSDLRALWDDMIAAPVLKKLCRRITHIEQPFAPNESLSNAIVALFAEWPGRPPVIIDEADNTPGACARALEWGYAGTVFRAERGLIPGIVDACLLGARRDREPVGKWTMIGGPLSSDLPLALLPELAASSALGLSSVIALPELFLPNADTLPDIWRQEILHAHPSTFDANFCLQPSDGIVMLDGEISQAPFGFAGMLDATALNDR